MCVRSDFSYDNKSVFIDGASASGRRGFDRDRIARNHDAMYGRAIRQRTDAPRWPI